MLKYKGNKKEFSKHIMTEVHNGPVRLAKAVILKPFPISVEYEPAVAADTGMQQLWTYTGNVQMKVYAAVENGASANGIYIRVSPNDTDDLVVTTYEGGIDVKLARNTPSKNTAALITAGIVALGVVLGVS